MVNAQVGQELNVRSRGSSAWTISQALRDLNWPCTLMQTSASSRVPAVRVKALPPRIPSHLSLLALFGLPSRISLMVNPFPYALQHMQRIEEVRLPAGVRPDEQVHPAQRQVDASQALEVLDDDAVDHAHRPPSASTRGLSLPRGSMTLTATVPARFFRGIPLDCSRTGCCTGERPARRVWKTGWGVPRRCGARLERSTVSLGAPFAKRMR